MKFFLNWLKACAGLGLIVGFVFIGIAYPAVLAAVMGLVATLVVASMLTWGVRY